MSGSQGTAKRKNSPRERRESIATLLQRRKVGVSIVSDPKHVFYLTGYSTFWPRQTAILILRAQDASQLFIGKQRAADARKSYDGEISEFEDYDIKKRMVVYPGFAANELGRFLAQSRILRDCKLIGLEAWHLPRIYVDTISRAAPRAKFVDITERILSLRKTKGRDELTNLVEASKRMEAAYELSAASIKPGMSEMELCRDVMSDSILRHGPFEFSRGDTWISGERTLLMGGPPTDRRFIEGDSIVLDLQSVYNNYWADGARTYVVGKPKPEQEHIFDVILTAKKEAEELLKPGALCSDVYGAVAKQIEKAGYKSMFPHHAGHGLGLEDQEPPSFIPGSKERLEEGVVCTIEPGIYHPKIGGFRDEDTYLITHDGYERITNPHPKLVGIE